jgi:hypothetical protein
MQMAGNVKEACSRELEQRRTFVPQVFTVVKPHVP